MTSDEVLLQSGSIPNQTFSVVSYNNMRLQDTVSPFADINTGGMVDRGSSDVSGASSVIGGKMLRPDYNEESAFQEKLNFSKHKPPKKKVPVNQYSMGATLEFTQGNQFELQQTYKNRKANNSSEPAKNN